MLVTLASQLVMQLVPDLSQLFTFTSFPLVPGFAGGEALCSFRASPAWLQIIIAVSRFCFCDIYLCLLVSFLENEVKNRYAWSHYKSSAILLNLFCARYRDEWLTNYIWNYSLISKRIQVTNFLWASRPLQSIKNIAIYRTRQHNTSTNRKEKVGFKLFWSYQMTGYYVSEYFANKCPWVRKKPVQRSYHFV